MGIGGQQEEGSKITCTIIATGFPTGKQVLPTDVPEVVVHTLDEKKEEPIIMARPQDKVFETPEEPAAEKQEEPEDRILMDLGDFEEEETPHFGAEKEEELPAEEASEFIAETQQDPIAETTEEEIQEEQTLSAEALLEEDPRAGFLRFLKKTKASLNLVCKDKNSRTSSPWFMSLNGTWKKS